MRPKFALAISTLALGTVLTAVPALAQDAGSSASNTQQFKYPVGRAMNDGGFPAQSSQSSESSGAMRTGAAENRGAPSNMSVAQNYHYPVGRAMNDGGFPAESTQYNGAARQVRTGSAANMERTQTRTAVLGSNGQNEAFDQYGQRSYYDYADGPGFMSGGSMQSSAAGACEARFRSYDPNTGTYLGFDGVRHACP